MVTKKCNLLRIEPRQHWISRPATLTNWAIETIAMILAMIERETLPRVRWYAIVRHFNFFSIICKKRLFKI